MADKVSIRIENESASRYGYTTGQTVDVDADEAKRLIRAGAASPAKVADAKAVSVPVESAATKK